MIDRDAREKAAKIVEAYLNDEIASYELDDLLEGIETQDETVDRAIFLIWHYYDDLLDHKANLSKSEWDFFQRMLLILRSDAELSGPPKTGRSWDHYAAWILCAVFTAVAVWVGWGPWIAWIVIPFGLASIAIAKYRERRMPCWSKEEVARFPFSSVTQMRQLWERTPRFKKQKYRPELELRTPPQSKIAEATYAVLGYGVWIPISPVVLFCQGFPAQNHSHLELRLPIVSLG